MWFVLGSLNRKNELSIRDMFRREGRTSFVPLRYETVTTHGHRERKLVPAVTGMVFIKGDLDELQDLIRDRKERLFLRKSTYSNREAYLTVSDHDMENFIAVVEKAGEKITYFRPDEINLRPGDKIRINGGFYDGREGVIMRVKGKRRRQLVVSIPGLVYAAVELEPELIELITPKSASDSSQTHGTPQKSPNTANSKIKKYLSKNLDEDKRRLFSLSRRLLFEYPADYNDSKEYFLLITELQRTYERVSPFKGYLPSQEAELALALYLASYKLFHAPVAAELVDAPLELSKAEQRLRKAMAKLMDTSLLKLKIQLYLGVLTSDDTLKQAVQQRVESWKNTHLSPAQKLFLEDFTLLLTPTD